MNFMTVSEKFAYTILLTYACYLIYHVLTAYPLY